MPSHAWLRHLAWPAYRREALTPCLNFFQSLKPCLLQHQDFLVAGGQG